MEGGLRWKGCGTAKQPVKSGNSTCNCVHLLVTVGMCVCLCVCVCVCVCVVPLYHITRACK